jgi:hypothetical protein
LRSLLDKDDSSSSEVPHRALDEGIIGLGLDRALDLSIGVSPL